MVGVPLIMGNIFTAYKICYVKLMCGVMWRTVEPSESTVLSHCPVKGYGSRAGVKVPVRRVNHPKWRETQA